MTMLDDGRARTHEPRRFAPDDVLRMLEGGILDPGDRVELLDGVILDMAPKGSLHDRIKNALARHFARALPDSVAVYVESTIRLGADLFEPDIALFASVLEARDRRGLFTLPGDKIDLIVEVADTTLAFDTGAKARAYARAGVAELWVVDVEGMRVTVHRGPMPEGTWASLDVVAADGVVRSERLGVEVRLAPLA